MRGRLRSALLSNACCYNYSSSRDCRTWPWIIISPCCASQGNGSAPHPSTLSHSGCGILSWWSPKILKCSLRWGQLVSVALGRLELQPFSSFIFLVFLLTCCCWEWNAVNLQHHRFKLWGFIYKQIFFSINIQYSTLVSAIGWIHEPWT